MSLGLTSLGLAIVDSTTVIFVRSDAQMSPRCTCNKFGDCSWFKPASCIQLNHQNGKCEPEESPVGVIECTGNSLGDICQLQCPEQFKAEQYG